MSGRLLPEELRLGARRVTGSALGPYQTAVVRIGFSFTWLCFLLREWPHRHELYGPDGPWSWELGRQLIDGNDAFTALMWSDAAAWFEFVYGLAVAASLLLLLGWRTRTMSVLFMIGVLSLQNRSVFMGDGGDNIVHLMSMYLVLTRCGRVWSLDARRPPGRPDRAGPVLWTVLGAALLASTLTGRLSPGWLLVLWGLWLVHGVRWAVLSRRPGGEGRALLDVLGNVVHNGALLVIMAQVCLLYATAGWYKIQGSRWQDGTAVHYPFHLDYFTPWPALSELLASNGALVMLVTYGTVVVQVAFPFTLANRRVKNVLLAIMITEHLTIAVTLGLPFFSLAMIAADAVFLPTAFLRRTGGLARRARDGLRPARWTGERTGERVERAAAGQGGSPGPGTGQGSAALPTASPASATAHAPAAAPAGPEAPAASAAPAAAADAAAPGPGLPTASDR